MTSLARLASILFVVGAGCGHQDAAPTTPGTATAPAPTPIAIDAAPAAIDAAPAPTATLTPVPDAVVPIFEMNGGRFLDLGAWYEHPLEPSTEVVTWGVGDPRDAELGAKHRGLLTLRMQGADKAPPIWQSAIGTALPAYAADGTPCPATLGGLSIVGLGLMGPIDAEGYDDSTAPILVAEVLSTGCTPVLATLRPAPRFYARAAPTAAQKKALRAGWKAAPGRIASADELGRGSPSIEILSAPDAPTLALLTVEHAQERDNQCGNVYAAERAVFTLPSTGAPVLQVESDLVFVDAPVTAVFDSDRDGTVELAFGASRRDNGMDGRQVVWSYLALTTPTVDAAEAAFVRYIGCD